MSKSNNPVTQRSGASTNIILTVIVLVVAVAVIGGVLWFGGNNNSQAADPADPKTAELIAPPGSNKVSDSPDDKVTLTEFLDFQCPACQQRYQQLTKDLEQKYQGKIDFVIRNFPVPNQHPLALPAAKATEAAADQGKYAEMYHALNDNYKQWAGDGATQVYQDKQKAQQQFDGYAQQIGLDMDRFHQQQNAPETEEKIKKDLSDGEKAGVSGTPTMFLNGQKFQPTSVQETYQKIDGLLAK